MALWSEKQEDRTYTRAQQIAAGFAGVVAGLTLAWLAAELAARVTT